MSDVNFLNEKILEHFGTLIIRSKIALGELTLEISPTEIKTICLDLRDKPEFGFNMLVDVCGVDYLHYGVDEWETHDATAKGFSRGVDKSEIRHPQYLAPSRFAAVYHLLSMTNNHRIRIKSFLDSEEPKIDSVIEIWPAANWFEREAYDLFGIIFTGHNDLRRILTDYGFAGHPFRKDFPMIGNVEVRYDAHLKKVIYEPVNIKNRVLEPKVIRDDNRYSPIGE